MQISRATISFISSLVLAGLSHAEPISYQVKSQVKSSDGSDLCLETNPICYEVNGCNLWLAKCTKKDRQLWTFGSVINSVSNGSTYSFLDSHSYCATDPGCKVQVWSYNGGLLNQVWNIDDLQRIVSGEGMCLDVNGVCASSEYCPVQIWSCNDSSHQKWVFTPWNQL